MPRPFALRAVPLAALLLAVLPASAEDDGYAIVHTLGARPTAGHVVALDAERVELEREGVRTRVPLDTVRELRLARGAAATGAAPHQVTLVGGEVLAGRLTAATDNGLTIEVPGLGAVPVSFDALATLEARDSADPCQDLAGRFAADDAADIAHLRGAGDRYAGTLVEANGERFVMESDRGRTQPIPWADLRVLHLQNERLPAPEGLSAEVELANGSRVFCAALPVLAEGRLAFALRSAPRTALSASLADVVAVRYSGGRFCYASDLPFESAFEPYYPVPPDMAFGDLEGRKRFWGARRDRRPSGCPLRVGGVTYRHGFSVHAKSEITIPLGGRYASFEAAFGIDDEVRANAAEAAAAKVEARVLVDGEVAWGPQQVTLDGSPVKVGPVPLDDAQTLVLVVDFGEDSGPVGDDAAWVDPILVLKE